MYLQHVVVGTFVRCIHRMLVLRLHELRTLIDGGGTEVKVAVIVAVKILEGAGDDLKPK